MRTTNKLDLRQALAATEWKGDAASIGGLSPYHQRRRQVGGGPFRPRPAAVRRQVTTIIGAGPSLGTLLVHAVT